MNILHIDRCHCERLEDTRKPSFVLGTVGRSGGWQHCYVKGLLGCDSTDMQIWDIHHTDLYPGEGGYRLRPGRRHRHAAHRGVAVELG
jgi:hypothetical protein